MNDETIKAAPPRMPLHALVQQAGTVRVRLAPLLMLIGSAVSTPNGPGIEMIVEMLDPEDDDG